MLQLLLCLCLAVLANSLWGCQCDADDSVLAQGIWHPSGMVGGAHLGALLELTSC